MKCGFCDGESTVRKVGKRHWHRGNLKRIENVEAEVCQECGERYYRARTLSRLDALIQEEHELKQVLMRSPGHARAYNAL